MNVLFCKGLVYRLNCIYIHTSMYLFILLLLGVCTAEVYTCNKDIEIPNLQICGMSQENFCTQTQTIPPIASWCDLTPIGLMILMDGECPSGFMDVSQSFTNRYIAVNGAGGTVGSPTLDGQVHVQGSQYTPNLMTDSFGRGPTAINSVGAATPPAVFFRLCRRQGDC